MTGASSPIPRIHWKNVCSSVGGARAANARLASSDVPRTGGNLASCSCGASRCAGAKRHAARRAALEPSVATSDGNAGNASFESAATFSFSPAGFDPEPERDPERDPDRNPDREPRASRVARLATASIVASLVVAVAAAVAVAHCGWSTVGRPRGRATSG